jgi:hypothetical protein
MTAACYSDDINQLERSRVGYVNEDDDMIGDSEMHGFSSYQEV